MCHIMDQGNFPYFDPQFFILNLTAWNEVGRPSMELLPGPWKLETTQYLRSKENYHDSYTPHWIGPGSDPVCYRGRYKEFGSIALEKFLSSGHKVINFDYDTRKVKWHLYPNTCMDQLLPLFSNGTITWNENEYPQLYNLVRIIKEEMEVLDQGVYFLNTEPLLPIQSTNIIFNKPMDHYIGVAAGLKTVLLLNQFGFHDNTKVTYIDISQPALDFQQYLIQHWNGDFEIYPSIVKNFQSTHPGNSWRWRTWNSWDSEIDAMLVEGNITKDEFYILWNTYRSLTHNFVKLSVLDANDQIKLVNLIGYDEQTYLWISNAFDMEYTRLTIGKEPLYKLYRNLVDLIIKDNKDCAIESCGVIEKVDARNYVDQFFKKNTRLPEYVYQPIPDDKKTVTSKFFWIMTESRTPYLKLDLPGPWPEILEEVKKLDSWFVPHRGVDSRGWSSLCLHGISAKHTDSYHSYDEYKHLSQDEVPYDWTEIAELCPIATDYFKNEFKFKRYHRLRFMKLDSGGYINPHHDNTNFHLNAINISLNNPRNCNMVLEGVGMVPFEPQGGAMFLNTSYNHVVWNRSLEPRYHMIAHGEWDGIWGSTMVNNYEKRINRG